jgi:protein-tyrosine phosphatase
MSETDFRTAVVARLRDALWTVRGWLLRNPPVPTPMRSALFVCKGNICRSPFASELARRLASEMGWRGVGFESAGITPSREGKCPDEAVTAAALHGVDLRSHRPVALNQTLGQQFDVLVVMDAEQFVYLRQRWPFWRDKIVLLARFDPAGGNGPYLRCNIVDPYGKSPKKFEECYVRLERSVRALLGAAASTGEAVVERGDDASVTDAARRAR